MTDIPWERYALVEQLPPEKRFLGSPEYTEKPISILTCNAYLYTIMKKLRAGDKELWQALCSRQTTRADRSA